MKRFITALLATTVITAFENPGWKMDGDKIAVDGEGNPIWIGTSGEMSVKGDTISRLNGEAANHRKRAETAEAALTKFEGITDPEAARKALETVKDLKDGDLINKGKLDEVKAEITKQFEGQISAFKSERDDAMKQRDNTLLDSVFNSSEFARSRLAVPVEMVRATFGDRFKVENGQVVAYDAAGNTIYSDKDMGAPATFDEALEKIVTGYKHKDTILKAPESGGTGGNGGGGNRGGTRTMPRSEFEKLPPAQAAEFAAKMATGEVSIVAD